MTNNKVELFKCFGGGWELWVGGGCLGLFPSKKAAKAFLLE